MHPGRDAPRRNGRHNRVCQFVDQHALEERRRARGAGNGNADPPVVQAVRPFGRTRDIAKLFLRVENHRDRVRRVRAERLANPPEGGVERVGRAGGHHRVGPSFEHHPETILATLGERAVHDGFLTPRPESGRQILIAWREGQRGLVRLDRLVEIAFTVDDLTEEQRGGREAGIHVERASQSRLRIGGAILKVRRYACAEQEDRFISLSV